MFASKKGHSEVVKLLLAHPGIAVNLQDKVLLMCDQSNNGLDITSRFILILPGRTGGPFVCIYVRSPGSCEAAFGPTWLGCECAK